MESSQPPQDRSQPDDGAQPSGSASGAPSGSGSDVERTRVSGEPRGPGDPRRAIPLGPSIEGYVLKEEIHRGGQGVVYRAVQLGTKRQVALKVLLEGPFAGESARRRFEREIELAAALRHPNIVTILDSGLSLGRYYFAMEHIAGERLDRYVAKHRPPLPQTLELFAKVCDAVNFAHQRGVLHRDLKPPNILVDDEGQPHILDFGLAKQLPVGGDETTVQVLSTSGQILGTVAYMSPEQAAGSRDVDVRSDVYSLGVIFYEALLGHPPYPIDGPLGETLTRIARDDPVNPRSAAVHFATGHKIDDELATILLKTLEKQPERRYQTAGDLGRDLRHRLCGDPIEAKRASGLYMFKKALRRYRLQATAAGAFLLMLVAFLIIFAVLFTSEREASERAAEKTVEAQAALTQREEALTEAVRAQDELRRALIRQHIQRGDLALTRNALLEARDAYWTALELTPNPAAVWALRRYYLQTANTSPTLLGFDSPALTRLSPNGRLVGVCGSSAAITLRDVETGEVRNWVRTPGPVQHLDVRDDGALAAAGDRWARAWEPGALAPSVSLDLRLALPGRTFLLVPQALYPVAGGRGLVVIGRHRAALFRGTNGRLVQLLPLQGLVGGPCDYSPELDLVAVSTAVGVELVSIAADRLASQIVWHSRRPPRALHFYGSEVLALVPGGDSPPDDDAGQPSAAESTTVYTSRIADLGRNRWATFVNVDGRWDLFDLDLAADTVAFATRDGRLALYEHDQLQGSLVSEGARLETLRLAADQDSVIMLDGRGTVTRWIAPDQIEQRRLLSRQSPRDWAVSADGSTALLAHDRGRVLVYQPRRTAVPRTLLRPRLLGVRRGPVSLSVDATGSRVLLLDGSTIRFATLATGEMESFVWRSPGFTLSGEVALSDDGHWAALLTRSQKGDQQRIALVPWPSATDRPAAAAHRPVDFVGAQVHDMIFVPQSGALLVVRSNGQLFLIDVHRDSQTNDDAAQDSAPLAPDPWLELDAPATAVAFSRRGDYLAAACEDGSVWLIPMGDSGNIRRLAMQDAVSALAFNPRNDLLLVRSTSGTVRLFDPASTGLAAAIEPVVEWPLDTREQRPLAAWIGRSDAMLLGHDDGVYEYRYQLADNLIKRDRPYARQREIARLLAEGEFVAACQAAAELYNLTPRRGRTTQIATLEAALRQPHAEYLHDAAEAILASASAATALRLGHAAYDGERFDLARAWLHRGRELAGGRVDAFSAWRAAECDYLAGAYDETAAELAAVLTMADFDADRAPIVTLLRVAALVHAGRGADARRLARRVGEPDRYGRAGDIVAVTAARVIARFIAGIENQELMSTGLDGLLTTFAEDSLNYHDDVHFFLGELALQRGEREEALVQYQRCIDLSRDLWPANWSRYRLDQLAAELPAASSEVVE